MIGAFDLRERAIHARHLARAVHQPDLRETLLQVARDYDETAEDVERDAIQPRHPELITDE